MEREYSPEDMNGYHMSDNRYHAVDFTNELEVGLTMIDLSALARIDPEEAAEIYNIGGED